MESFKDEESVGSVDGAREKISKLRRLNEAYRRAPFVSLIMLLGALSAGKSEGQAIEKTAALLSTVELLEQTREDLSEHPELVKAVEKLAGYQNVEMEHGRTTDWHAYTVDQSIRGEDDWLNFQAVYPDIPQTGSGLFSMSSMISDAYSKTENEELLYSGMARHFNIQLDAEITPVSEPHTFEVSINEGDDINDIIINGFVAEISERIGQQIQVEDVTETQTGDGDNTKAYQSVLKSQASHTFTDLIIKKIDDTTYSITYRDGWVTNQDLTKNTMNKFEMSPSSEGSREFKQLSDLMGGKDHVEGMSEHGAVYINKWPNGSIEVSVFGINGIDTKFTVSEGMGVRAEAEKPARSKFSHEGGGIEEHQYLSVRFSLDDVLSSFQQKTEIPE